MTYPKQIMTIKELQELGFSKEYLKSLYRRKGQTFAWKMDPLRQSSTILFDTEKLEKYIQSCIRLEEKTRACCV